MLAYESSWTSLIIVVHLIVISLLSWQVWQRSTGWQRYLGLLILFPWFGATIAITQLGLFEDMTVVLSPLGLIMTLKIGLGLWLMFRWAPMQTLIQSLPLSLIALWAVPLSVFLHTASLIRLSSLQTNEKTSGATSAYAASQSA